MRASSLRFSLAFDQVFPLVTPKIHILPIHLNQDNRGTKDELMSRKLKKKSIFFIKIFEFKIFQQINQIYLPYLFTFWLSSLVLIF